MSDRPAGQTVPGNRWDLLDGLSPAPAPRVSVIVVHYEQPEPLRRTLAALARQTHPASRMEIIVVDDGSQHAPDVGRGVRLLRQPDRGARPGAARNLGASEATGDVLCFLDADTTPEPAYVSELSRLPALAPEAVTVGRRRHADLTALGFDGTLDRAPETELPEPGWLRDGYGATRDLLDADARSYRFVISAVLACSRWFFDDTGPFADFDSYGGEDWEWAHRAWRNGAIFAHVPRAVAWHDGPDWSGRAHQPLRRTEKNRETLRLADLIGVPGSGGRALRPWRVEEVVRIADPGGPAASFVCVDSLLEALPRAAIVLPAPAAGRFAADGRVRAAESPDPSLAWPRLELEVARPVQVGARALRAVCDEVTEQGLARLVLGDSAGPLIAVGDFRALRRARRWDDREALAGQSRKTGAVAAIEEEPDLEGWVGGWGGDLRLLPPPRWYLLLG